MRVCFAAFDRLAREATAYQREFGVAINVRAGLRCRKAKSLFMRWNGRLGCALRRPYVTRWRGLRRCGCRLLAEDGGTTFPLLCQEWTLWRPL